MAQFGFCDRILHVNLTDHTHWIESPGEAFFRRYGGGRGLIAHYILKDVPTGTDPLAPGNVLVMAPGVLTGAAVPGAGRHSVGALSPLSGGYGESEAGGFWGAELKRAGWDAIVCHGASETPVYLWITEDTVEIRDASHLWGKITGDVEEILHEELGDPRIRIAQIGPAGENLVRFASLMNDLNEAAGRSGMGAVMGSKKLKAIAVRGKTNLPVADQKSLTGVAKWVSSTMEEVHYVFHEFGTGANMRGKNLEGGMPSLNYRLGQAEGIELYDAEAIRDEVRINMTACFACSVRCKKVVQIEKRAEDAEAAREQNKGKPVAFDEKGRWSVDPKYGGPEYESLAALGANLGVDDIVGVCKSNEMCNYLGLDTISAGATIAWAMECYEKGVLTEELAGGAPLHFKNAEAVIELLTMIAYRQGIGDLLAEGSQRASAVVRGGSEEFLTTVKGMEMAMHDPRHMPIMRQSYLLAPTGGDHMRQTDHKNGLRNQIGLCHFLGYNDDQSLEILNAVTGWDLDDAAMHELAQRGITLTRLVNLREGFTRADDTLPPRFREPLPMHEGMTDELIAGLVESYYKQEGWDVETGVPTAAIVQSLGIAEDAALSGVALATSGIAGQSSGGSASVSEGKLH
ncbi:MAG: aldehyde ferredoxin oxidoreductase family protein [Tepidiformaceae bacterium]